ncbi:MAG: hypothetical protein LBQ91_02025 [Oscillospiraceae bacterium]|jgi:hypothetical protein|nr:hypothetical protein [Oscillospiraceae bacterium]
MDTETQKLYEYAMKPLRETACRAAIPNELLRRAENALDCAGQFLASMLLSQRGDIQI